MPATKEIVIEYVKPEDITPATYNPRRMRPSAFVKLKEGLQRFGMVDPLIVNSNTGVVVGGHQRLRAAIDLGWEKVPIVRVDLTPDEEKALNIALNNAEMTGTYDKGLLTEVLDSLKGTEFLTATGFDERQIAQMIESVKRHTEVPTYPLAARLLEHYDYVVIFATHETDWMNLQSIFRLKTEQSYKKSKVGLGRVVPFERFLEVLEERGVVVPEVEPEEVTPADE